VGDAADQPLSNERKNKMSISINPNKALWEKGDFTQIAATMRESGEALVQKIGINRGMKVLDLGCGDGTTAIPAAKLGAEVLGVDIARNLVDAGNRRAQEMGLTNCRFQEGDATNLASLPDRSFDVVVSIFGAMFAPKPHDVAKEVVRVTRRRVKARRRVAARCTPSSVVPAAVPRVYIRLRAAAARAVAQRAWLLGSASFAPGDFLVISRRPRICAGR